MNVVLFSSELFFFFLSIDFVFSFFQTFLFLIPTRQVARQSKSKKISNFKTFFFFQTSADSKFSSSGTFSCQISFFPSKFSRNFFLWGFNDKAYMFDVRKFWRGKYFRVFLQNRKKVIFLFNDAYIRRSDIAAISRGGGDNRQQVA